MGLELSDKQRQALERVERARAEGVKRPLAVKSAAATP